jgi:GNAT superfamily N-acetyltransferase
MEHPKFHIRPATSPSDLAQTKVLFTAYASSLPISLTFQNFAQELASLPGLYAPPTGIIFLAFLGPPPNDSSPQPEPESLHHETPGSEPVGVIALRPLPSSPLNTSTNTTNKKACEIKRLYLTPSSRGLGIGKVLVEAVIQEARRLGYEEVKLDTLRSMTSARKLYEGAGFVEVEKYYDNPFAGTAFLGMSLR